MQAIINFFVFFFKTILNPGATDDYAARSKRGGGSGGGGGGPPRPRITGLAEMRDASGGEQGAGGRCRLAGLPCHGSCRYHARALPDVCALPFPSPHSGGLRCGRLRQVGCPL